MEFAFFDTCSRHPDEDNADFVIADKMAPIRKQNRTHPVVAAEAWSAGFVDNLSRHPARKPGNVRAIGLCLRVRRLCRGRAQRGRACLRGHEGHSG